MTFGLGRALASSLHSRRCMIWVALARFSLMLPIPQSFLTSCLVHIMMLRLHAHRSCPLQHSCCVVIHAAEVEAFYTTGFHMKLINDR